MSRILLITSNFPPVRGGSASVYANLARHLGAQLTIMAPTLDYADGLKLIGWREHDRAANFPVVRLPLLRTTLQPPAKLSRKWMVRAWDACLRVRLLARVVQSVAFEVVRVVCVGELMAIGWLLPLLRLLPAVRTAVYVHGEEITTIADQAARRRATRNLRSSDRIIVVSGFTLEAVRGLVGRAAGARVVLIQNGVDTLRFRPGARSAALEAEYGLAGKFAFVSVSRLVEKKGHDNAIRAFAGVAARFPDTRLLIVGDGPYRARLEQLVAELGLAEAVVFVGAVSEPELLDFYHLGDAFVMPNRVMPDGDTEGFGLVFLEANSCGLPVIAGKDGGSTEAVDHDVNGLVVDGRSVAQIAAAMLALRTDAALRVRLSRNGMTRAAQSDWSSKAQLFAHACLA